MIMKKLINWGLMLAATLSLTNCTQEIDAPVYPGTEGTPFEILVSTPDAKTLNNGMVTNWAEGDKINVFHAVCDNDVYKSDTEFVISDLAQGRFTGKLSETLDVEEEYDWFAFYPYDSHIETPANTNSGYMTVGSKAKESQTQNGNNSMAHIAGPNYPLSGFAIATPAKDVPVIPMSHVSSLLEINVTNNSDQPLNVTEVTFTAPDNIVGTYYIDFTKEITPESFVESGDAYVSKTATLVVNDAKEQVSGQSAMFYIAVKPFVAAAGDKLTINVNGYSKELSLEKSVEFTAGKIKKFNFSYDKKNEPEPEEVVWDLTKASYESASTEKVVWSSEFVNLTLEKGASSTSANNHLADEHSRVYKNQIMTFDPLGKYQIESIEFAVVSGYVDAFAKATWVNGEPVTSGNTVVVTPTDGHAKVSATLGEATRFTSITVYYSYDENYVLPTVESIAADGQTSELMQGSEFVFGGTVTATYSNGETADVTSAANFSGYDMSASGEQTVEVSYTEGEKTVKTTYQLTVLPADADVTDKLNLAFTGQSGTTYGTWSGKTASSDAVYAGNSAGGNSSIQMRSDKSNSGIVTTNSGGYAKKVVVTWNSNTTSGRTLNIYGKNTAYSAATDLYDSANQGTLLGKIKMGTSTEFVIPGNYQYIGLRSADGAMYITEIQITWSSSPIALESIAVSGQKTDYYVGDSFVAPTVTATYSDGSSSVVSGAEFSGYDMSKEGEQTVTVSYTQGDVTKETIYTINVNARPALESIAIDGTPTTEYTVGGSFVAPSVKATYSDGLKQTVAAKFSGYDMSKEGEQTVTVSYTEGDITAETTYKIVVKAAPSGPVEKSATLSFANKAQRTSFSSTQQVWEQNGIKFTNDKSSSTTAVADYAAPVRLYANSKVTVEAPGNISKIVFDCNSSSYATAMKNSIGTVSGATVSVSSDKVTVTFTNANAASFVVAKLTAQVRMDSITVTYLQ